MPRAARKKSESGIYHVMLRGINHQVIFQDDEDCEKYLQCLEDCKAISGFMLHAYCLMGNHLHLLLQEGKESPEQIFKRVGVRYVYWYNWKYKRTGPLFQDRFKSEPVNDDAYFLAVLRYIYQNPVKAGLCKQPADYPWSSYNSTGRHSALAVRTKVLELLPEADLHRFLNEPCEQVFLDIESEGRLNDCEAIALIKRICKVSAATDFPSLPTEQQTKYLRELCEGRCTIRQLSRLLGMDRMKISRMVSS